MSRSMAICSVPSYLTGSMKCLLSELCEETQLGESGQGESLPSVTPRLRGRHAEQPSIITVHKIYVNPFMSLSCYREFTHYLRSTESYHEFHINEAGFQLF